MEGSEVWQLLPSAVQVWAAQQAVNDVDFLIEDSGLIDTNYPWGYRVQQCLHSLNVSLLQKDITGIGSWVHSASDLWKAMESDQPSDLN